MKLLVAFSAEAGGDKSAGLRATLLTLLGLVFVVVAGGHARAHQPSSVADIAEKLQAAVVNISTSQTLKSSRGIPLPEIPKGSPLDEYFDDLFDDNEQQQRKVSSLGSGFVIDESGIIVTNYHVIEGAEEIIANFHDGSTLKVEKILGRDPKTDLAILKVEPKKPLTAVKFGDSAKMRVGDWVVAIGNPFGLGGTVTVGIISAKQRDIHSGPYDDFIQTDAAINRGNSGGPLFDMDGNVIGVNTAIISPTGGSIGIGFAIPSNTALPVIDQLKQFGETRRGWLGVYIRSLTDDIIERLDLKQRSGAVVASIQKNSPAASADIKAGDVIVTFDGKQIKNKRALTRIVAGTPVDKTVKVELLRNGERRMATVVIGRLPEEEEDASGTQDQDGLGKDAAVSGNTSLLGLNVAAMTDALRKRFKIGETVKGVVITEVTPGSVAAQKEIAPGDVIVEVAKEEVKVPEDVERRLQEVKKAGTKTKKVLLLISDGQGALRFIAVPIEDG